MPKPKIKAPKLTAEQEKARREFNAKWDTLLKVSILECKPNKMFTEWQRQGIRFLRFSRPVPCAECGKKKRTHWTALYEFRAGDMTKSMFVLKMGKIHQPLTPVCDEHPLGYGFDK